MSILEDCKLNEVCSRQNRTNLTTLGEHKEQKANGGEVGGRQRYNKEKPQTTNEFFQVNPKWIKS